MSTNPGAVIIQLILNNISDSDNKSLQENLDKLPLAIIPEAQADSLISWLLNQAAKTNNIEATRIIVTTFDVVRARVNPLPAITNIFLNPSLSRDVLIFTISCFPEKIPIDFFIDLINMGNDMDALKAAGTIITVFPPLSNDDWNTLVSLTDNVEEEEYENQLLRAFFQTKAAETGAYSKPPEWVRQDIPEGVIQEVPDYIPSVKDAVDMLLEDMGNRCLLSDNQAEVKETLISQYAISSTIEKIQMLSAIKEFPMFDDSALFQKFGPVNTMYTHSTDIDRDHECTKWGGCRMFLCKEFENSSCADEIDLMACDEHIFVKDWFTGSCDVCRKKIRNRQYALRLPLHHGGWKGCRCLDDNCLNFDIQDPQIAVMVGRMKEQLKVIGIRDD